MNVLLKTSESCYRFDWLFDVLAVECLTIRLAGGWQAVLACVWVLSFWEESQGTKLVDLALTMTYL